MFAFLRRRTLLILALALMAGVVYGRYFEPTIPLALLTAGIAALVLFAVPLALYSRKGLAWVFVIVSFAALGTLRLWYERHSVNSQLLVSMVAESEGMASISGRVVGFPRLGGEYARVFVDVYRMEDVRSKKPLGRMVLYWKADEERDLTWGDRISFVASLKLPEPPKNPGEFNYREYMLDRGVLVQGFAFEESWVRHAGKRAPLMDLHVKARKKLFDMLAEYHESPLKELLICLVYGDKTTDLDPAIEEKFRRAGLTHILVVSGTQVSLIVFLLICLFVPVYDDQSGRGVFARVRAGIMVLAVVLFYCTLTGFETSIVRALVMGFLLIAAKFAMKETDGMSELARASIIILAFQPGQLFGASFQLSFAAFFGLIYFYGLLASRFGLRASTWRGHLDISRLRAPEVRRRVSGWRAYVYPIAISTFGAQIFVLPILILHFNQFSAWGLISNILAIPLASLLLVLGIAYNLIGLLGITALNILFAKALGYGLMALNGIATVFGSLAGSDIRVATPSALTVILFYLTIFLICETWRVYGRLKSPAALRLPASLLFVYPTFALAASFLLLIGTFLFTTPERPRVVILSKGHGLAFWAEDASGVSTLVLDLKGSDAARRNIVRVAKNALWHYGISAPDKLVLLRSPDGEDTRSELELLGSGEEIILAPSGHQEQGASSQIPVASLIWAGRGAGIGYRLLEGGNPSSAAFSIAVSGKEVLVVAGDPNAGEIENLLAGKLLPSAIVAKGKTLEKMREVIAHEFAGVPPPKFVALGQGGKPGMKSSAQGAIELSIDPTGEIAITSLVPS